MTIQAEFGEIGTRNIRCWCAILDAVEQWHPKAEGAVLEVHFEKAERIGLLARLALIDLDLLLLVSQRHHSRN